MSKLDLNALNELPKVDRILALAETNAQLEKLDAEGRVAWALDNLPGEYVLSSSFGSSFRAFRSSLDISSSLFALPDATLTRLIRPTRPG